MKRYASRSSFLVRFPEPGVLVSGATGAPAQFGACDEGIISGVFPGPAEPPHWESGKLADGELRPVIPVEGWPEEGGSPGCSRTPSSPGQCLSFKAWE